MTECRPISRWNTIYICITNVLVRKLKSCLDRFICSTQTALIPGRRIAENVLAQELVRNYHRNLGQCAIKVGKTYDLVNWKFLPKTLTKVGIPRNLLNGLRLALPLPIFELSLMALWRAI